MQNVIPPVADFAANGASIQTVGTTTFVNANAIGATVFAAPVQGFQIGAPAALFDANGNPLLQANYPVQSETFVLMTGTATKGGFNTGTVTLPQLAQVFKALLDNLTAQGVLFTGTE